MPWSQIAAAALVGALVSLFVVWFALGLNKSDFARPNRGKFGLRRRLFFIASTALLLGLCLLFIAPSYHHRPEVEDTIRDVARAFVAAAIIGFIVELAEMRDFFTNIVTHLVTSDDFTRQLVSEKLNQHSVAAITEIIHRKVTNPDHAGAVLASIVIGATVPQLCRTYRESYSERIDFSAIRSLDDLKLGAERAWGKPVDLPLKLAFPAYLLECSASFFLVPPTTDGDEYSSEIQIDTKLIDGWAPAHHARCVLKVGDELDRDIELKPKVEGDLQVFSGKYTVKLQGRRTRIQLKTWEFNADRRTGFTVGMTTMTRGLTVVFASDLELFPEIWAYSLSDGSDDVPLGSDRRIASFSRSDYVLLAGHGYGVSWSSPIPGADPNSNVDISAPRT